MLKKLFNKLFPKIPAVNTTNLQRGLDVVESLKSMDFDDKVRMLRKLQKGNFRYEPLMNFDFATEDLTIDEIMFHFLMGDEVVCSAEQKGLCKTDFYDTVDKSLEEGHLILEKRK